MACIAVHIGCGRHPIELDAKLKKLCARACTSGMALLKSGAPAVSAAEAAVIILENNGLTNAGRGSNLNEDGEVECDACITYAQPQQGQQEKAGEGMVTARTPSIVTGAIGASRHLLNPVAGAAAVARAAASGKDATGRLPPICLVGEGAVRFAARAGVQTIAPPGLVTAASRRRFELYSSMATSATNSQAIAVGRVDNNHVVTLPHHERCNEAGMRSDVTDTVGAVCVDLEGGTAAAASSGGPPLKRVGRLGPAAIVGAGCFAEQTTKGEAIAVSTSGIGEEIIAMQLGSEVARKLRDAGSMPVAIDAIEEGLLGAPPRVGLDTRFESGVLALLSQATSASERTVEILVMHTAASMGVGFMASNDRVPTVRLCRAIPSEGNDDVDRKKRRVGYTEATKLRLNVRD